MSWKKATDEDELKGSWSDVLSVEVFLLGINLRKGDTFDKSLFFTTKTIFGLAIIFH